MLCVYPHARSACYRECNRLDLETARHWRWIRHQSREALYDVSTDPDMKKCIGTASRSVQNPKAVGKNGRKSTNHWFGWGRADSDSSIARRRIATESDALIQMVRTAN